MDPLSEALATVRVTGAIFFNAEYTAPWGFNSPLASRVAHQLAPGTERLIVYHLVTQGSAQARIDSEEVTLKAGDIVMFPFGDAHSLSNGRPAELVESLDNLPSLLAGGLSIQRSGGGGDLTSFVCGYIGCERHADRLFLAGLPRVLRVNVRGEDGGAWLEGSIRHGVAEAASGRPGRHALLSKLSETLFVETLRRFAESMPPGATGWLAGARDEVVGRALAHIHAEPARDWSVASLAEASATSRSVLAARFAELLGEPPMAYLGRFRLHVAGRLLRTTRRTMADIAYEVGYESEAAFNRAFKREFGLPPARFRKELKPREDDAKRA